jgi:wyosine [tRNA(Phe)-imidazoG37] synthetase (radical SAM superfamily)
MTFDKDLNLKGQYCYHPFNTITVDGFGDIYMCICQAWLPVSVGKIWEFDSFEAIVECARAREIQSSILDGTYKYCDHNTCSIIKEGELSNRINHRPDTINWINFSLDNSCNLTCPSCRTEFKFISDGIEYDRRMKIVDHMVNLLENHNHWIKFTLAGDGDPFASLIYRQLMSKLDLSKNNNTVEIEIITNGVLAKAHWHKLSGIHKNLVRTKISFDAGTESVYNITRRGGDWNKLLESSTFLANWKQKTYSNMILTANFVVQTANYQDMPAYVELCDSLGFNEINFQKIVDWGTFDNFKDQAVWMDSHPLYQDFLSVLQHPSLNNKKINFTNLK